MIFLQIGYRRYNAATAAKVSSAVNRFAHAVD